MFSIQEYQTRRSGLASALQTGIALLNGNNESPMNYRDNTYHFRQDSSFLYYIGISAPSLNAVIDSNGKIILFGDEMTIDEIVWMGRLATLKERAEKVGITDIRPSSALASFLSGYEVKDINWLPPYRADITILLADLLKMSPTEIAEKASLRLIKTVVAQRSVKSEAEIKELHKASDISADMHLRAMQFTKAGMTEAQVAAAIHEVALANEGELAYPIILSKDGHILHNHHHGNILKAGDMVLNDSGAETNLNYAGDLTRTFPVAAKFTSQQKELYNLVLTAYNNAVSTLKAGVRYLDVHYTSCKTLANGLKDLGLMKGDIDDAVAKGAHALFFQCGTGHMIGMDVHDMENLGEQYVGYTDTLKKETKQFGLKSLRLGKELGAGYVLTVEPGLYFIPELIDMWKAENKFGEFINYNEVEKFRNFTGIRVEDDYVVTDSGYTKLGKPLAIKAEDVEAIRASVL